jgi:hypothetical protein
MPGRSYPVSSQTLARWKAVASGLDTQVAPGTALTGDGLSTTSREMKRTTLEDLLRSPLRIGLSKTRNIHFEYSKAFIDPINTVVVVLHSPFLVVLAVALPAVYGGVHLSAWNFDFPTPMEHLLWKSACLIIIGAVPAVVGAAAIIFFTLLVFCLDTATGSDALAGTHTSALLGDLVEVVCYKICGLMVLLLYGCARVYIVVESSISIRAVPIGVYYTPSWLQMIPHA